MPRQHQSLWHAYQNVKNQTPHFAMQKINALEDIYPVLAKLFQAEVQHDVC